MAKQNHSTTKDSLSTAARKVENSTTGTSSPAPRTYPLPDYGDVSIAAGSATDFASRRADQLYSLLMITHGDADFHGWNSNIKDGVLDLAAWLANDLVHLIPFVQADAVERKAVTHGC